MMDVIYDLETSDPDDAFTLCWLSCNSKCNLRAVTITPGTQDQVNLVRYLLFYFELDIPIGVRTPGHPKNAVSDFHYKWLDKIPETPILITPGYQVLKETIDKYPDVNLLTGASLGNPRMLFEHYPDVTIKHWIAQGGFAGDNIVPEQYRLPKFAGKTTCPTFNFNGDVIGAKLLLSNLVDIKNKQLVSKNVCHGLAYNQEFHDKMKDVKFNKSLELIYKGMEIYLKKNKDGKLFHDPLAAAMMINPDICESVEVEVYREKGEWDLN